MTTESQGPEAGPRGDDVVWLSTDAAAKLVGVTPRTLYRFLDGGDLRGYRFGRVIRIKQSDVDTFIEASVITPGSLQHLYPS